MFYYQYGYATLDSKLPVAMVSRSLLQPVPIIIYLYKVDIQRRPRIQTQLIGVIVERSINMSQLVIYVSMNYRYVVRVFV